ncbi:MAG: AAA family ATPase, partial [Planctomycetota bacterium]
DRVAAYVAKESARLTDRLGFITRESESESRDATVDLAGLPGVIGPAADLVRDAADAEGLTRRLLATTWIVESVAIATSLAAGRGHGLRFVTPQGELLEADGTLTAGSVAPRARVVSRQSEKRALRAEITRLRAGAEGASSAAGDESDDRLVRATEAMLTRAAAIATADSDLASENRATAQSRSVESARDAEAARQCVEGSGRELEARREEVTDLESARSKLNDRRDDLTASLERLHKQADTERENAASETTASERVRLEERLAAAVDSLTRSEADLGRHAQVIGQARADLSGADEASTRATLAELAAAAVRADAFAEVSAAAEDCERLAARRDRLRASHRTLEERTRGIDAESSRLRGYEATASAYVVEARARRDQLCTRVAEEFDVSHDELLAGEASALRLLDGDDADALAAVDLERLVEEREGIEKRVDRLRRKLKAIGAVNPDSLADLDALEERHTRLASQLADLTEARAALRGVIDRVDAESRKLFSETFEVVRGHFRELFRQVFGGGDGDVVLEDPPDPLAGGVEIIARPPGKEPRGLSLLSGGEKTMTCVALMFALFRAKPSPFCVLDEVDAALDEANIERFVRVLELFKRETQFVMITHRKPSMAAADVLHGVTMEDAGVSKRLAIRLDEVADDGAIATTRRAA